MIEPIEGIPTVPHYEEPAIKLSPREGNPNTVPDLKENEEAVLEFVKKGDKAFVGVLLETGFDKDLTDIEREVYENQRELRLVDVEIALCTRQRELIKECADSILNSEDLQDPHFLKLRLLDDLSLLLEFITQDATKNDSIEDRAIRGQFRLFTFPPFDELNTKTEYFQLLQQHQFSFNNLKKLSEAPETFKTKLDTLRRKREGLSCSLDDSRLLKREVDNIYFRFNNDQLEIYQGLIYGSGTFKIPPRYTVNRDVMEKILRHKVSPNLVDPETGNTLLHIALAQRNTGLTALLMSRGADPLKTNRKGDSAMKIASNMEEPLFLAIITASLKKSDFLTDQMRNVFSK
jgi:hypothetical protein